MHQASRFGARVLLLLAAAVTAAAAQQDVPLERAAWLSVKLVHFIFGAIGASLMVTTKPLGWGATFATLFAGVGCAIVGTPLALERLEAPSSAQENAIAAVLGASGLYIVAILRAALAAGAKDPIRTAFAVLDRWRGIRPPPAPPIDDDDPARSPK